MNKKNLNKIRLVQQGPTTFQSLYGNCGNTKVDLLIDFCTTTLLGNFFSIRAAIYSLLSWSVYSNDGEVPPLSEYKHTAGRILPSTSSVWMVESGHFLSFTPIIKQKKTDPSMAPKNGGGFLMPQSSPFRKNMMYSSTVSARSDGFCYTVFQNSTIFTINRIHSQCALERFWVDSESPRIYSIQREIVIALLHVCWWDL